jgi:hypothetical protein
MCNRLRWRFLIWRASLPLRLWSLTRAARLRRARLAAVHRCFWGAHGYRYRQLLNRL